MEWCAGNNSARKITLDLYNKITAGCATFHSNRAQATAKKGVAGYDIIFPKYNYVVGQVTEDAPHGKYRTYLSLYYELFYK